MKVPESSPQQNPLILWELFASRQKFAASPVEWGTLLSDPAVSLLDSGESNPWNAATANIFSKKLVDIYVRYW